MTNNKEKISVFIFNKDNVYYDKGDKNFKNDKYLEGSFSEFIIRALRQKSFTNINCKLNNYYK